MSSKAKTFSRRDFLKTNSYNLIESEPWLVQRLAAILDEQDRQLEANSRGWL